MAGIGASLLSSLGRIAGTAGIGLGVLLLVYRDVLRQKFLSGLPVDGDQASRIVVALLVLTFGIATVGAITWIVGKASGPKHPPPLSALIAVAGLAVAVLTAAVIIAVRAPAPVVPLPGGNNGVVIHNTGPGPVVGVNNGVVNTGGGKAAN
jgi:hypothetical protein